MITVKKKKVQGLIVKKDNYKEDSLKITVLTEDGLESFIIRGAKKIDSKMRPISQLITFADFISTNNLTINTITEGTVIKNYTKIKDDSLKTLAAVGIVESVITLIESITDFKSTYKFILKVLDILNDYRYSEAINLIFHIKFLYAIGLTPHFQKCVNCNDTDGIYFNVTSGGLVCEKCRTYNSYSHQISKLVQLIFYVKLENINDDFIKIVDEYKKELYVLLKDYYLTHLDYLNKTNELMMKF